MLKLKNVSKFYYSKGIVASGFSKVNVEFNIGEFVAITGESGSGKSTLLNVISGLDTYEEGEMYINGEETSHYTEKDFEIYRRKYIGNIFQNFSLVNSYTVYQNIELVLLINGYNKKEVKSKILSLIKEVGLTRYKDTKVSKLSGGQKQRVAIARALAKDTKVIVADEPTGNLDSKSAKDILELLYKISADKLVIVVTHNYEQIEKYVTRKIKMYDGKIIEDKVIKKADKSNEEVNDNTKFISLINKIRLGIRNTFNVIPKFILLFIVYIFITVALTGIYSSFQKQRYEDSKLGYNNYFRDLNEERIIIKRPDNSSILESDFDKINKLDNINYIFKDDYLLDTDISLSDEWVGFYGSIKNFNDFNGKVDVGRLPETDNEIIISGYKNDYYLSEMKDQILEKEYTIYTFSGYGQYSIEQKAKIVGISYIEDTGIITYSNMKFYFSDNLIDEIRKTTFINFSSVEALFNNVIYQMNSYMTSYRIVPNNNVPSGKVYIPSDMNYLCKNENCINNVMEINIKNQFFEEKLTVSVLKTYDKNNFNSLTKLTDYEMYYGVVFVNSDDYYNLFNKNTYQSSVFVSDYKKIDNTINDLQDMGFQTLKIRDTVVGQTEINLVSTIFRSIVTAVLTGTLIFVSYFVIKLILKSRNIYFTTIRILGASKKVATQILQIELWTLVNITYITFISFIILVKQEIIENTYISNLTTYLETFDYIILYLLLILLSLILSNRFSRKLFKKSAMNTYREEV